MSESRDRLNVVAIFHYVLGGIVALSATLPLVQLVIGFSLLSGSGSSSDVFSPFMRWLVVLVPAAMIVIGVAFALGAILAGMFIRERKHYTFCMVMAGVECLFVPLGTVLGVLAILLLTKQDVKEEFARRVPSAASRETAFAE